MKSRTGIGIRFTVYSFTMPIMYLSCVESVHEFKEKRMEEMN